MILEEETFIAFRYYPSELKSRSNKPILAACDDCGKVRKTCKGNYHSLCKSCVQKGNTHALGNTNFLGHKHTEISKALMSAARIDNTNALGHILTDEQKAKIGTANKGKNTGEKHFRWNGGKKVVQQRSNAKRKRQLGFTLLMPLAEGEVGHHFTDEYVIGIPKEIHQSFGGRSRKKHRALVLDWLKINDKKKYEITIAFITSRVLKASVQVHL